MYSVVCRNCGLETAKRLSKTEAIASWNRRAYEKLYFAMCILSERREKLNQEAPLAKKLKKAYNTLNDVRGGAPMVPSGSVAWGSIRQRIFKSRVEETLRYRRR